jgi:hypothetical protein
MQRWRGTHVFDQLRFSDDKYLKFGDSQDFTIRWDGTNNRLELARATNALTDPGRQIYASFTATGAVASGKQLTGIQISATFNGTGNNASVTAAEFKARHTTGNTATVVQLRGVVGNADAKNGTVTTAYPVEASMDVSSGGTVTNMALIHANLNNSGTVTNSYVLLGEGTTSVYIDYGIYLRYCNRPFYATGNLTGATAKNAMELVVTDAQTNASGYARGLYISCTASGAKTSSGEHNSLGVDLSVSGNTPYAYIASFYMATSDNPTIGLASALSVYIDDLGTACAQLHMLDLQYGSTNAPTTRNAYMRIRNHSDNTPTCVIYLQANNNALAATYFIEQEASTIGPVEDNTGAVPANCTHVVECKHGADTFYLLGTALPT